ncbi:MAG: chemotaxis response regulator protein-glutamate methylesterase [Kofleriaceae bacterium]|nr:chemotaxis response regulator protein-glutamate methylesterase [Kofleriaceae bacterium]MCB9574838.1 chemotaxis response regulator protein-glutamate methylesterase [Kofleriaceae bacterium]
MRAAIAKTLAAGPFEVVGQARNGREAVDQVVALGPDVVTMDFNMPEMNGAEAVRAIMQRRPTPVLMFSAHTRQGARETFEALAAGAVDFVTKPAGEVSADLSKIAVELTRKLTIAAASRPRAAAAPAASARRASLAGIGSTTMPGGLPRLCVIAVSTGGPAALSELVPALPGDSRFAVVIVQHMPAHFTAALAERLDAISQLTVREAAAGDRPTPGLALIAPGDRHVEFDERGAVVLTDGELVHGCRPAADVTMISAARVYGRRAIGVVMTGMGKDGAAGALAIKRADGKTLAQDQQSSVIFGMPKAAIEAGAIDEVAPLDELAARLRFL